jgi:hypothetical protein
VSELERRLARPVDVTLAWTASETRGGGPASGYQPSTRVTANFSSRRTYKHVRPDPQYCDGTTCNFPGDTVPQASCARRLEVDVEATVKTADKAVEATLRGTAWSTVPGSNGEADSFAEQVIIETRTLLSQVRGTLRVSPEPGASSYRTSLALQARRRCSVHSHPRRSATTSTRGPRAVRTVSARVGLYARQVPSRRRAGPRRPPRYLSTM